MFSLTKIYLFDKSIYLVNQIENLPKSEKTYSQFGQDSYVFNILFNKRKSGIFVDVGGNHPIICNNTFLFEENGWSGLALEPQDNLRNLWIGNRKTKCLDNVVGPVNKDVIFIEGDESEHGLSGIQGFNKVSKIKQTQIVKKQRRLDDILLENNLLQVDYLSIDVEGYEMSVLESVDFSKVDIKVIEIENDIGFKWIPFIGKYIGSEFGNKKIRNFLKRKGYKHVARIMCDDFFIKK
ncbi:MAG: FkbM family methyltransferase [Aliarcobacter sp.]|nr:FkbM family methyltransferase [Aliarcobacter sp.]